MYFKNMPKLKYQFSDGNFVELEMQDVFRRVTFTEETRKNESNFEFYVVREGESPDVVAYKFYGDDNLWWLILMFNNIIDVENEWPKSLRELSILFKNFLNGDSYYILESPEIQKNDIIVKRDVSKSASVDVDNFGIVESYDPFLHKIDVKRSKGTLSGDDEFYIFRGDTNTGYFKVSGFGHTACAPQSYGATYCSQIVGPTAGYDGIAQGPFCATAGSTFGIIRKKTSIEDGILGFEYESADINPYATIVDGGPSGDFYTTTNMCGLTSSILYKYINGESIPTTISPVTVGGDILNMNDKNRIIKVLSPNIVPLIVQEFVSLLNGDIPQGTTKYVQLIQ